MARVFKVIERGFGKRTARSVWSAPPFGAFPSESTGTAEKRRNAAHSKRFALLGNLQFAIFLLLALPIPGSAAPPQEKPPPPAYLKISGYGLLGNRQLKRMLRTLELGGKKPPFFGSDFVEDAALILSSRVKSDGYLQPIINIDLLLADGRPMKVQADDLLDHPLPHPLRITRVQFKIHKGVLYHFQGLEFRGLASITPKQARSYFVETEILLNVKHARIYTPERLRGGISSLTDSLDRQGYQNATVEATELSRNDQTGAVSVRVDVHEGQKFIIRSVREAFS